MNEEHYTEEDKQLLAHHVTNLDKSIYVIKNLPPEVVAVLFAYVSRSPNSFRENLLKLIKSKDLDMQGLVQSFTSQGLDYEQAKEKARKFHEKWVVGYGHSSVAEHALASVAIEDVSILASKVIEDNRLASYTEKSTRYQVFNKNRYYKPRKIMKSPYAKLYEETADMLFTVYNDLVEKAIELMKKKYPKEEGMSDAFYESISKARACDVIRYLLPAATLTNLAMTANARVYEHAIRKFLSSELEEMHTVGTIMKEEIQKIIPTLVKYANENAYLKETVMSLRTKGKEQGWFSPRENHEENYAKLVQYDPDAENKVITAILYRFSNLSYEEAYENVQGMDNEEKYALLDAYLHRMGRHDWPMRELEHIYYSFEMHVDYGAFRDIQRHRMSTQTTQLLTTDFGYSTPKEIIEFGMQKAYEQAMQKAHEAYQQLRTFDPVTAQYIVPLGYRIKSLFTWNLRELFHFIKLRSGKEGHESYRKIAIQCYEAIKNVHPVFAKYITVHFIEGPARG